jgi:hypothetical protein
MTRTATKLPRPTAVLPKYADNYRGADKSLARSGRKQPTETEDFDIHISHLL